MTPSYITSSYGKIGGKKSKSSLALDAASPASLREPSQREQGDVRNPTHRNPSHREMGAGRQPTHRNPMGGGTSTGGDESGGGRIGGPSITLRGEEEDPFQKFLKEQRNIKNMRAMQLVKSLDKAIRDPNYMRNLKGSPEDRAKTIAWAESRKQAQSELRGRQGHSSPRDTRNRYQS